MAPIQQKAFPMKIYARSLLALAFIIFVCTPAAAAPFNGDCGFIIDLPIEMTLKKDLGVLAPLCSYLDAATQPTPFVNSVTMLPWTMLDTLQVSGQPLRDIGFFRLSRRFSISYLGRPSYTDSKNLYEQKVVKKPAQTQSVCGKESTLAIRSELKVKWLKPIDVTTLEESTDTFVCVDAAISDKLSVAIVNWCLPKSDPNAVRLVDIARSLRLGVR